MVTVAWADADRRKEVLDAELARIAAVLDQYSDVLEVWIFGSAVQGGVHRTSDLDIFVVRETDQPPAERGIALWRQLRPTVPVDLFVYTPEEAAEGGRFVRTVKGTGRRLK